jgi:uncharacterized phage protein (TIGR02220 family)
MSAEYIKMKNWDRWQTYRTDRGNPPWIKVYRALMRNIDWITLTDAQRGQLVAMWLLAADKDGRIPADPATIKTVCSMTEEPDLKLFKSKGFVEFGAKVTPERRQVDAALTPQSRVDQSRVDQSIVELPLDPIPYAEIIGYLAKVSGTAFEATGEGHRDLIKARWAKGRRLDDFKAVIDGQAKAWRDKPEMLPYMRPSTLFSKKHFDEYLAAAKAAPPKRRNHDDDLPDIDAMMRAEAKAKEAGALL